MARSSVAHSDRYLTQARTTRRLHLCGAGLPRVVERKGLDGRVIVGFLLEGAAVNKCLQSRTLATTWAKIDAGDTITNATAVGPDGSNSLCAIKGDATDGLHGVSQAITLTAAAWVVSGLATVGNKTWLYVDDSTIANCYGYYNLTTGVIGTKGAGANVIGSKLFTPTLARWWMTLTGTAAAHTIRVCAAHADGDNDFSGDGSTANVHAGDIQVALGLYPSSRIVTVASAVTRTSDAAIIWANPYATAQQGHMSIRVLIPAHTPAAALGLFRLYTAGAAATDHITISAAATTGYLTVTSACSGGDAGSSAAALNIADGKVHDLYVSWKPGCLVCWADQVAGVPDTVVSIPANLDTVEVMVSGAVVGGTGDTGEIDGPWPVFSPRPLRYVGHIWS